MNSFHDSTELLFDHFHFSINYNKKSRIISDSWEVIMLEILKSKIHQATVTDANINYEGSITISKDLIDLAGICVYQKVLVVDINNGQRFETYVISTDEARTICVNGAAARLVSAGDRIIIMAFEFVEESSDDYKPTILILDENNEVKD
jgi:aspartate 1-decarboxylase